MKNPGIQEIRLPPEVTLEMDKVYVWLIAIPCTNNPQKSSQVLRAAVKRVPVSAQLANQLQLADSSLEKSQIYAKHGIWYDALTFSDPESPDYIESVKYIQQLGREVGIIDTHTH